MVAASSCVAFLVALLYRKNSNQLHDSFLMGSIRMYQFNIYINNSICEIRAIKNLTLAFQI